MNRVLGLSGHASTHRCIGHARAFEQQQLAGELDAFSIVGDDDEWPTVIEPMYSTSCLFQF